MQIKGHKQMVLSLVICAITLLFELLGSNNTSAYAITGIKTKEVTIALSKDSYPVHFLDEKGKPAGILVDFWNKWSKKTGIKIKFVPSDFGKSIENVKSGLVDLHAGCFYSKEREKYFEFGAPVFEIETNIFYEASMNKISNLRELKAYRIGVIKGDYAEGYLLKNLKDSNLVTFDSYKSMFEAADQGRIKTFVADKLTAIYEMNKLKLASNFIYNSDYPLYTNYVYTASKKGNRDLINEVNLGMAALTQTERNDIISKWTKDFGSQSAIRIAVNYAYPPFSYEDKNGKPQGLLIDLWKLWSKKTNRKIEFVFQNFESTLTSIKNGNADIHAGLFETTDREKYMIFTRTLYPIESQIFYNPKYSSIPSASDLDKKKIGVEKMTYQEYYLREKYPQIIVSSFSNNTVLLEAFDNHLLDGLICESINSHGMYELTGKPYPLIGVPGTEFSKDMKAAVSKSHKELIGIVNRGLDAITNDEWIALENKWISDPRNRIHSKLKPLNLTSEEKEWIKKNPIVRIGAISEFKPYNDNIGGSYAGISADFMNYTLSQIGITPVVKFAAWEKLLNSFGTSQGVDVIFSNVHGEAQAESQLPQIEYTKPYLTVPQVVVTRTDLKSTVNSLDDLSNLKVAVEKGYYKLDYLKKNAKIKLVYVDNTLNAMLAVSSGQADAYIGDTYSTKYYMDNSAIRNLKSNTYSGLPPFEMSVVVSKKLTPLKSILQKALSAMPEITKKMIFNNYEASRNNMDMTFSDSEAQWLKEHNAVHLTLQTDWKPISFLRSDKHLSGIAYAMWEKCQNLLGINGATQSAPNYRSAVETVMNGTSDVLIAAIKSPEKLKFMNFTEPYMVSPLTLLTHEGRNLVSSLEAVGKETIGVISGSYAEDIIKNEYPKLACVSFSTQEEAYKALSNKKIDVLADSLFSADYSIKSLGYKSIRVSGITGYTYELCIGVRKDWPELVNLLNRVISTMSASERTAIEETWVTQEIPEQIDWTQILAIGGLIIGIFMFILLVTIYWNRKLQKEIIERKVIETELVAAKEVADIASNSKSEFLANMSHEIRTPMNAIIGMINLLNNTEITQRQHEYLSKISHAAYSLLSVINDILDFSKIEAGKLSIESIDFSLDSILVNVSDIVNIKARDKNLELLIRRGADIPDNLIGDPLRIEQILINLANNAVKFTAAGEVEIAVRAVEQNEDTVTLEFMVRDTGIGIDESRLEELFKPFTQSDTSTTRKYGGTGLGLSICHSLVELMGGRIWANSIPNSGCSFYFEVKLASGNQNKFDYPNLDSALDNHRVLLVDDNRTALEILAIQLKVFQVDADTAKSGEEALEKIKRIGYDLVFMDWRMPGIDGFETAKRIRKLTNIKQPRIVMITAYGQDKKLYDAELHLDAVLHKPVNESALFNTLQSVMLGNKNTPRKLYKNHINPEFLVGFKILAVEDNPLNQQIIFELLELSGAKVYEASNGNEALDLLEHSMEIPDAILMDLQMPQLDGYETTRCLRKNPRFAKIPVFAMTADVLSGVYDKCIQAGMDDYISKPIDLEELYGKLGQFLNISKSAFIIEQYEERTKFVETGSFGNLLNLELALRQLGNNENLLMSILKRFQNDYANIDAQIDGILESEPVEVAVRFFHTLKATAGSIGSENLHKSSEIIEKMLTSKVQGNLEPYILQLKSDMKVLLNKIESVLADYETEAVSKVVRIELDDLLEQLKEPLQNRRPAEIEAILSQVDLEDFPKEDKELLSNIHYLCNKYRYKDALKLIEEKC